MSPFRTSGSAIANVPAPSCGQQGENWTFPSGSGSGIVQPTSLAAALGATHMARIRNLTILFLAALVVLTTAAPAGAKSLSGSRTRRSRVSAKRAELARKINALKATDAQLEAALRTLDAQLRVETARADKAKRAAAAADAKVRETEQRPAAPG